MFETIRNVLTMILALVIGVSVHESAHGLSAYWLGDATAKNEGRITLNPLKHIEWYTVVFALAAVLFNFGLFIPFKPVPVNHFNLRDRRWGPALTAAAGPVSNLLLAIVFALLGRLIIFIVSVSGMTITSQFVNFMQAWAYFCMIQFMMFSFNLIPIPPLDGHWILGALLPPVDRFFDRIRQTPMLSFVILIVLLNVPGINILMSFVYRLGAVMVSALIGF